MCSSNISISTDPIKFLDALSSTENQSEEELNLLIMACEHIKNNDFIKRYVSVANELFKLGAPVDYYYLTYAKNYLTAVELATWTLKNKSMDQSRAQAIKRAITWCLIQEKNSDFLRAFVARGPKLDGSLQGYRKDIDKIIGDVSNNKEMKDSLDANGIVVDKVKYFKSIDLNQAVERLGTYTHCKTSDYRESDGNAACPFHLYVLFMPQGSEKLGELATSVLEEWELYTNKSSTGKVNQQNLETEETKYYTNNPGLLYRKFLVREFLEKINSAIVYAQLSGSGSEEKFTRTVYSALLQGNTKLFEFLITREEHPSWSLEDVLIEAGIHDAQEQTHGKQKYLGYFAYGSNLQPILIKYLYESKITVGRLIEDGFKIAGNFDECIKELKDLPPSKRQNDPKEHCLNKLETDVN